MPEDTSTCPVCGTPLPRRPGGGLCPACLVSLALDDDEAASEVTPGRGPAHSYQVVSVLDRQPERSRYLAKRRDFHALVALEIVSAAVVARLDQRAIDARLHLLRSLRHPGIAHHLESWIEPAGECCLVSEYTVGRALAHCAELQDAQVLGVFDAVCEAVAAAHGLGAAHGRLSAASVVLVPAGRDVVPQIIDFTILDGPCAVADDVAALGRVLAFLSASRSFAEAAARLAARCEGQGADPPLGTVRALQAAVAAGLRARDKQ